MRMHSSKTNLKRVSSSQGCRVLIYINKNQLNISNVGKHTGTSGTSKSTIDFTRASLSLQPILFWTVTYSLLSSDHCVITLSVQSLNSWLQTTTTNFNINKSNWYIPLFIKWSMEEGYKSKSITFCWSSNRGFL